MKPRFSLEVRKRKENPAESIGWKTRRKKKNESRKEHKSLQTEVFKTQKNLNTPMKDNKSRFKTNQEKKWGKWLKKNSIFNLRNQTQIWKWKYPIRLDTKKKKTEWRKKKKKGIFGIKSSTDTTPQQKRKGSNYLETEKSQARLFSSYHKSYVIEHFQWYNYHVGLRAGRKTERGGRWAFSSVLTTETPLLLFGEVARLPEFHSDGINLRWYLDWYIYSVKLNMHVCRIFLRLYQKKVRLLSGRIRVFFRLVWHFTNTITVK